MPKKCTSARRARERPSPRKFPRGVRGNRDSLYPTPKQLSIYFSTYRYLFPATTYLHPYPSYPSTSLPTHLPTYPPTHLPLYLPIILSTYPPTHLPHLRTYPLPTYLTYLTYRYLPLPTVPTFTVPCTSPTFCLSQARFELIFGPRLKVGEVGLGRR